MNTLHERNTAMSSTRTARRRRLAGVAAGVLTAGGLTAVVLGTGLLSGPAAGSQAPDRHSAVLSFGVRFSPQNVIDVPPLQTRRGDYRAGDYAVFGDVLTDRAGRRVGTEAGTGTITLVNHAGAQIFYTMAIRLKGGQLAASGLGTPDPHKHLAVTGGTGSFVGARGSLRLVENGDGTGTLRIRLR